MQMSRMSLLMIAAGSPAAAVPAGPTAEEALERYREVFAPTPVLDCPPSADPDEVVVCARAGPDPNRLPLPTSGVPGERTRLIAGEAPQATTGAGGCLRLCPQPVGVNVLQAVPALINGIKRILDPDS